jgi:peptide/nickel transport system substrate-binding protein
MPELSCTRRKAPPHALLFASIALMGYGCSLDRPNRQPRLDKLALGIAQPTGERSPSTGISEALSLIQNEGLVSIGTQGRAVPRIAESWTTSSDSLTWRFVLRPNVRFHNGTAATPQALAARLKDALAAPDASGSRPGFLDLISIDADERSVIFRLSKPSGLLLSELRDLSLPTGPFYVWRSDERSTVLRTFDSYYQGRAGFGEIELRRYPTMRTAWAGMMRGEIDAVYEVAPDALGFVERESEVRIYSSLRSYSHAVVFNVRHPVLRDVEVRQALNRAVNRDEIVRVALKGRGLRADSPIWPEHFGYDASVTPLTYAPAEASGQLTRAGLPLPDVMPASQSGLAPSRFRFTCLIAAGYPLFERLALIVQRQLFDVGVDMEIQPLPMDELNSRLAAGRFDAFLLPLRGGLALNWIYQFWHSVSRRHFDSGYADADRTLDGIRHARSDDELRAAMSKFQRVLISNPPGIFLCWDQTVRAVSHRVAIPADAERDVFFGTLWRWRPAEGASTQ